MEKIVQPVFDFLSGHSEILSFLSPILAGDSGVILLAFLAAGGAFPIFTVFIFAFLGMITADSLWFFIPKTKLYQKIVSSKKIYPKYEKIEERLEKFSYGKDMLVLMLSKIIIGTRIIVIIFIGAKKMKYKRFLSLILLPNLIWTAILVSVGFLTVSSYKTTLSLFSNIQLAIFVAVLFILLFFYSLKRFTKWTMKK